MHSRRGIRGINHSGLPPDGLFALGRPTAGAFLLSSLFAQLPRAERSEPVQHDIGERHLQTGLGLDSLYLGGPAAQHVLASEVVAVPVDELCGQQHGLVPCQVMQDGVGGRAGLEAAH
jgi:hypothetical protein